MKKTFTKKFFKRKRLDWNGKLWNRNKREQQYLQPLLPFWHQGVQAERILPCLQLDKVHRTNRQKSERQFEFFETNPDKLPLPDAPNFRCTEFSNSRIPQDKSILRKKTPFRIIHLNEQSKKSPLWTQFTIFIILKNTKLIEFNQFIPYTLWILVIFFRHYLIFNHRVTKKVWIVIIFSMKMWYL